MEMAVSLKGKWGKRGKEEKNEWEGSN